MHTFGIAYTHETSAQLFRIRVSEYSRGRIRRGFLQALQVLPRISSPFYLPLSSSSSRFRIPVSNTRLFGPAVAHRKNIPRSLLLVLQVRQE